MDPILFLIQKENEAKKKAASGNSPAWTYYAWKLGRVRKAAFETYARLGLFHRIMKENGPQADHLRAVLHGTEILETLTDGSPPSISRIEKLCKMIIGSLKTRCKK